MHGQTKIKGISLFTVEVYEITLIYAHRTRLDSSGQAISPSQRPLHDNTQHSQQTDIHAPGGIRNRIPKWADAQPCFRPRGHWHRSYVSLVWLNVTADRDRVFWMYAVQNNVVRDENMIFWIFQETEPNESLKFMSRRTLNCVKNVKY